MSRLNTVLQSLRASGRKALIPYVTAGDPRPDQTAAILHTLVRSGADVIELGVPFSDPMADGPVIQLACERALAQGTSLARVLEIVAQFRESDVTTPVVLMGYLNPIEAMGLQAFAERARAAGVDAVLTVDLPPEEAAEVVPVYREHGLDSIFLIAPTTTPERIEAALQYGSGYLYYVSLKGVTGAATLDVDDVSRHLDPIRARTDLPVAVGFGIKDAESAAAVSRVADGVIVGSALVRVIEENGQNPDELHREVAAFMGALRQGLDTV